MKKGDIVTIFIDGKICSGIFQRYGGYAGLYENRVYIQFEDDVHKYYKKEEILKELADAGFKDLKISHRHNYSWTVIGKNL